VSEGGVWNAKTRVNQQLLLKESRKEVMTEIFQRFGGKKLALEKDLVK